MTRRSVHASLLNQQEGETRHDMTWTRGGAAERGVCDGGCLAWLQVWRVRLAVLNWDDEAVKTFFLFYLFFFFLSLV